MYIFFYQFYIPKSLGDYFRWQRFRSKKYSFIFFHYIFYGVNFFNDLMRLKMFFFDPIMTRGIEAVFFIRDDREREKYDMI